MTKDTESSYTASGIPLAKFTIAVDRFTKNPETGEKETDFIPVVCWRRTAEFATQYLGKGRLIGVVGRLQIRNWVDQQGVRRYMTEVIAEHVQGLDRPRENTAVPAGDVPADDLGAGDPFAEE
jgi:single-strand DNA-binding protein